MWNTHLHKGNEHYIQLLYIKLIFNLFVQQMGTLKLLFFFKFRRLYKFWPVFLHVFSNMLDVRDSLRSNTEIKSLVFNVSEYVVNRKIIFEAFFCMGISAPCCFVKSAIYIQSTSVCDHLSQATFLKRPLLVSDHHVLIFWVVTYGRFDFNHMTFLSKVFYELCSVSRSFCIPPVQLVINVTTATKSGSTFPALSTQRNTPLTCKISLLNDLFRAFRE